LLLDGVSSFGAEEIKFDDWRLGACAATANKCLHGVPGTSFVIVRRSLLPSPDAPKRNLYLDIETYCRNQDQGGTPFTQSVQTFYALAEALLELKQQGGWRQRRLHYRELVKQVRAGLEASGIKPLLPVEDSSCVLNSFELPAATSYEEFHDYLKEAGFVIYAGQGALLRSMFRVSTMGAITSDDMMKFLAAVKNMTDSR
jgi:2-aminoethylphosphonate-pyruvate transaminase